MQTLQKINIALTFLSSFYPKTTNTLKIIGFLLIFKKIINSIISLYKRLLRPSKNLIKRYGEKSWVLVTGSSQGIGKAIAIQFAKKGFNIILSARSKQKLLNTKNLIENTYGNIEVDILPVDYSNANITGHLQQAFQIILQKDISVVVNNVGVDVLQYYHLLSLQQITKLININCLATAQVTRIILPKLIKRNKRSAIINLASVAGQLPMPLHNVYSASKVFVDFLSRSLSYQYPKIDVMSVHPSQVSTPMTFNKPTDLMTIKPQDCAKGIIRDLGHEKISHGHWSHALQSYIYEMVPQNIFNYVFLHHIGPDFMRQRLAARQ